MLREESSQHWFFHNFARIRAYVQSKLRLLDKTRLFKSYELRRWLSSYSVIVWVEEVLIITFIIRSVRFKLFFALKTTYRSILPNPFSQLLPANNEAFAIFSYLSTVSPISTIERFHSRGQHTCKFTETKGSVYIRKEFNSQRIGLVHQHGRRDVMWKRSIVLHAFDT